MKPEAQRIAIAEACGWTDLGYGPVAATFPPQPPFIIGIPPGKRLADFSEVPDYLHDLNAMQEAERVLTNQFTTHSEQYWRHLWFVKPHPIYATATQRAEAFLRTLGKWVENPEERAR